MVLFCAPAVVKGLELRSPVEPTVFWRNKPPVFGSRECEGDLGFGEGEEGFWGTLCVLVEIEEAAAYAAAWVLIEHLTTLKIYS